MIIDKLPNTTVSEGNVRLSIQSQPWTDEVIIWMITNNPSNNKHYNIHIENGRSKETEVTEGQDMGELIPFLRMSIHSYNMFASLFAKVENEPKETVRAELVATKYHLEDLRKLVFKEVKE
jgi:hypothetical protein